MAVAFNGMESLVVTFQAQSVTAGHFAAMSENDTVKDAENGTAPVGRILNQRGDHAAVQVRGYAQAAYSGDSAPSLGWNQLVADGAGGLRLAQSSEKGRDCLVVRLDTEKKTVGLFL